jgi:hypothetical protein
MLLKGIGGSLCFSVVVCHVEQDIVCHFATALVHSHDHWSGVHVEHLADAISLAVALLENLTGFGDFGEGCGSIGTVH